MTKYISGGPHETEEIGFRIGKRLKKGNTVALYGELGSGKTVMAKGIARAFGIESRDVVSASFTIIAEYPTDPPFVHIDLYRVGDEEIWELGLWEYIGGEVVSIIEWAEKAEEELPEDTIRVRFSRLGETKREITVEGIYEEHWHNL